MMSVLPPGGQGMMIRIGFSGQAAVAVMGRSALDASRSPRM
jgi:hypothetical protein